MHGGLSSRQGFLKVVSLWTMMTLSRQVCKCAIPYVRLSSFLVYLLSLRTCIAWSYLAVFGTICSRILLTCTLSHPRFKHFLATLISLYTGTRLYSEVRVLRYWTHSLYNQTLPLFWGWLFVCRPIVFAHLLHPSFRSYNAVHLRSQYQRIRCKMCNSLVDLLLLSQ